jgi:hypothetical protein
MSRVNNFIGAYKSGVVGHTDTPLAYPPKGNGLEENKPRQNAGDMSEACPDYLARR